MSSAAANAGAIKPSSAREATRALATSRSCSHGCRIRFDRSAANSCTTCPTLPELSSSHIAVELFKE